MSDPLRLYSELGEFLDNSEPYKVTTSEFQADGQRWLLVTQRGEFEGGQLLFRIEVGRLKPVRADSVVDLNPHVGQAEAASIRLGANVSEVARRNGLSPQQFFGWRREAHTLFRDGADTSPADRPASATAQPGNLEGGLLKGERTRFSNPR
jgi:hypothetical protein